MNLRVRLEDIMSMNEQMEMTLQEQKRFFEEEDHSQATVDDVRASSLNMIEENYQASQNVSQSMQAFKEEMVKAMNTLPRSIAELNTRVAFIKEEKDELSKANSDNMLEIGGLRKEITLLKNELAQGPVSKGFKEPEHNEDFINRIKSIIEESFNFKKDQEFQQLKSLVNELKNNSIEGQNKQGQMNAKLDNVAAEIFKLTGGSL